MGARSLREAGQAMFQGRGPEQIFRHCGRTAAVTAPAGPIIWEPSLPLQHSTCGAAPPTHGARRPHHSVPPHLCRQHDRRQQLEGRGMIQRDRGVREEALQLGRDPQGLCAGEGGVGEEALQPGRDLHGLCVGGDGAGEEALQLGVGEMGLMWAMFS